MEKVIGAVRSRITSLLFWTLAFVGLGLLFLVAALPIVHRRDDMEGRVQRMTEENQALRTQNDYLEKEQVALLKDPFYIEKIARRELNMRRPGEMQVHVVPVHYETRMIVRPAAAESVATLDVDLSRLYATLRPLVEDDILRRAALILGALTFIAGVVLFGREQKVRNSA